MLIWFDLETTGLDEVEDRIMEFGMVATSDNLEIYEKYFVYIFPWNEGFNDILSEPSYTFVREMHETNGLIDAMKTQESKGYVRALEECEAGAREWLAALDAQPVEQELCGASVHFDRAFLKWNLPHLEAFFHYRNFDVSTLKRSAQLWNPTLYKRLEENKLGLTDGQHDVHRAIADCYAEIREAKMIRDAFLISEYTMQPGQMPPIRIQLEQ